MSADIITLIYSEPSWQFIRLTLQVGLFYPSYEIVLNINISSFFFFFTCSLNGLE